MTTLPPILPSVPPALPVPGGHAPLSKRRLAMALAVAGVSDLLSVWCEVVLPVEWLLDLATAAALFGILGRRWILLPALIAEAIPVIAIFPAWVLVVFAVAATGGHSLSPAADGKNLPPAVKTGMRVVTGFQNARLAMFGCAWAMAAVFTVGILTAGFLLLRSCDAPARLVDKFGNAIRGAFVSKTHYTTTIASAMGEIQHESKIVVCTNKFPITVTKSSGKTWELLGETLDLGTTSVSLTAIDNRVQYVIKNPAEISFTLRENPRELLIEIPAPVLDETIVEVQSNPNKIGVITEAGWARSKFLSGKALEGEIRSELRTMLVREGRHPARLEEAGRNAVRTIGELVQGHLKKHGITDLSVRVVIKPCAAFDRLHQLRY